MRWGAKLDRAASEKAAAELPEARAAAISVGIDIDAATFRPSASSVETPAEPIYRDAIASLGNQSEVLEAATAWVWTALQSGQEPPSFEPFNETLSLVREASNCPGAAFRRDFSQGLDFPVPMYAEVKRFAKALAAEAVLAARAGNLELVRWDLTAVQRMGRQIDADDALISQLVGIAISKIGLKSLERAIAEFGPTAQAISIAEEVLRLVPQTSMMRAARVEVVLGTQSIRRFDANGSTDTIFEGHLKDETRVLGPETVKAALEARHLQVWTRVMTQGEGLGNEEFGELFDRIQAKVDRSSPAWMRLAPNPIGLGSVGRAMRGLELQARAFSGGVEVLRAGIGPDTHRRLRAEGLKCVAMGRGFQVVPRSFRTPRLLGMRSPIANFGFTYSPRRK